jgi:hypothetical protein
MMFCQGERRVGGSSAVPALKRVALMTRRDVTVTTLSRPHRKTSSGVLVAVYKVIRYAKRLIPK